MKTKLIIILAILISLGTTSCRKGIFIRGNNNVSTETRELSGFSKLANNGSFEVTIIKDTISYVVIEAESNIIPYIETSIKNGALIIDSRETISPRRSMKLTVYTPEMEAMELKGSGSIFSEAFESDSFSAVVDGSGDITATASCSETYLRINGSGNLIANLFTENLDAEIHGSGSITLYGQGTHSTMGIFGSGNIKYVDFEQKYCAAKSDGSGNIYVQVSDGLDAQIFGSGSIYYRGNPLVNSEIIGSGSVIKQ
ncbi:head GIN domain-containing protein [Lentimicrobium sp. S6]|uniref:head GIN domain-containing protein n=1 Tax=Lentimicrobium sp. S6 TaxID=2735872 RepID=UPI0015557364|nr:head GIN domain-containing protein [Lentimicrobium sp. S6]NPD45925.1 DUF2807 domain-containing protein [Lentimicrobium sp. S6]